MTDETYTTAAAASTLLRATEGAMRQVAQAIADAGGFEFDVAKIEAHPGGPLGQIVDQVLAAAEDHGRTQARAALAGELEPVFDLVRRTALDETVTDDDGRAALDLMTELGLETKGGGSCSVA